MLGAVLRRPLLPGATWTVVVTANTNGQALSVWVLAVVYDPAVLTFVSATTAASYTSAVVTYVFGGRRS
jgi:hypothetical protein